MEIKVFVIDPRAEKYKAIILKKAKELAKILRLRGYLEVYLVGNRQMEKNVLSYCAKGDFPRPDLKKKFLGEIHLNPFFIKKSKWDLIYMLTHGVLHIAGYDHKKKNDRMKMEKKEAEVFKRVRLSQSE